VQGAAGGALQQAQETSGQVAQQQGGGGKEEPNATLAAKQKAKEHGVDLSQVEGSGTKGRITLKDVPDAIKQG
jgi:pyruvate/2-oxoglutarate dehydrogenase complex dihydrolipoamide acyltransferase (E2) component